MSILIVGSFMTDLVVRTHKAPQQGETVIGNHFDMFFGGKGANQAISAFRQGSRVHLLGALGDDAFGDNFLNFLNTENFDTSHIERKALPSGVGQIVVNETTGQNQIIIIPGANLGYDSNDLMRKAHLFKEANLIVNQLEMSDEVTILTKQLAKKYGKPYLLNPAPYKILDDEFLNDIDYLTPNESELAGLVGKSLNCLGDYEDAAKSLVDKGVKHVIVTLGGAGALHCNKTGCQLYPSFKVNQVLDTTAAGDTFNGAFAAQIDQGYSIHEAIIFANAAGALSVTKQGAIPSIPTRVDVLKLIEKNK